MTLAALKPQTIDAASGDTVFIRVPVTDRVGTVVDLTNFTGKFTLVDKGGSIVASTEESPATATITWPDRTGGIVRIEIDKAVTDAIDGSFEWELQLTNASAESQRSAFGYLNLPENLIAA